MCVYVCVLVYTAGVGIDGGNSKDWENNAKSIHLIKHSGKVKVLDEEIHSTMLVFKLESDLKA